MVKSGTDLQEGDVIKVWWHPGQAKVRHIYNYPPGGLNAQIWGNQARWAVLCAPHTKAGTLEMTIEPQMMYEVEGL